MLLDKGLVSAADMLSTMLFPRSASELWRLKFDSQKLESDFQKATYTHERSCFLQAFNTFLAVVAVWLFFTIGAETWLSATSPLPIALGAIVGLFILVFVGYIITGFRWKAFLKKRCLLTASSLTGLFLMSAAILAPTTFQTVKSLQGVTPVSILLVLTLTIFLSYNFLTIPVSLALGATFLLTLVNEVLFLTVWKLKTPFETVFARLLLYVAVHLLSIFVRLVYESRMRTGFWYGAQSLIASQRLDVEKRLRQKLVLSIMPQAFAEFVFSPNKPKKSERQASRNKTQEDTKKEAEEKQRLEASTGSRRQELLSEQVLADFQPKAPTNYWLPESSKRDFDLLHDFHVEKFENVSIIYANICGFTTISSKKSPKEWVPLLNEIFDRFDGVCWAAGCEKISILGDRYICTSGCPTPREDHAAACIEAGLGMCKVIETFNLSHNEELSVHVGIHTGSVQAGLFGTKRYKFDIWGDDCNFSNDVMESSDQPGRVIISADTYHHIKDDYNVEEAKEIYDFRKATSGEMEEVYDPVLKRMVFNKSKTTKTYLIIGRQKKCRFQNVVSEEMTRIANDSAPLMSSPKCSALIGDAEKSTPVGERVVAPQSFIKPAVNRFTLAFNNSMVESEFNDRYVHEPSFTAEKRTPNEATSTIHLTFSRSAEQPLLEQNIPSNPADDQFYRLLGSVFPDWISYGDSIVSLIVAALVIVVSLIAISSSQSFILASTLGFIVLAITILMFPAFPWRSSKRASKVFRALQILLGALFCAFPAIVASLSFNCQTMLEHVYIFVVAAALLHFALFAQVPYYVRTILAFLFAIGIVLLLSLSSCDERKTGFYFKRNVTEESENGTSVETEVALTAYSCSLLEISISLCFILTAVALVARRSELALRTAVYTALESRVLECAVQRTQKRNDELLAYVVPLHVLDRFAKQQIFYQHHPNCGVVVVRMANFADYYEESFSGCDESLHVLNQIFSQFEGLLEKRRFKDVEKVKTSVPSLLCAAGLDAHLRTVQREKNAHLYALMAYCFELIELMRKFNKPRQFKFKMRIGFDIGDLVSGILGSTLLHYDVWGDKVNFANKMCLGAGDEDCLIQVSEAAAELLKERYNFEPYNTLDRSGKEDVIKTYIAVSEKPIVYKNLVPPPNSQSIVD